MTERDLIRGINVLRGTFAGPWKEGLRDGEVHQAIIIDKNDTTYASDQKNVTVTGGVNTTLFKRIGGIVLINNQILLIADEK